MTYGVALFHCVNCQEPMDAADTGEGQPIRPPADGDLLYCPTCYCVMIRAQGRFRLATNAELARAKTNPRMAPLFVLLANHRPH